MALQQFSPAITLIIYAIQAQIRGTKSIDVNIAFTSLAIIEMVSMPANTLLSTLPEAASLLAGFDRIQKYLLSPDREDKREFLNKQYANREPADRANGSFPTILNEAETLASTAPASRASDKLHRVAINVDHVTIRPASTANPVLEDISATLNKGDLVVISGAVGTGKTTLVKALLGDLPPDTGVIQVVEESVAYCSQTAWLINGTVKEAICGPLSDGIGVDDEWYKRVVHACDLEEDLDQMPERDQAVIGSRGITLSGGQKQRVVGTFLQGCWFLLTPVLTIGSCTGCICSPEHYHS